jgi:hypothetical protein
MGTIHIGVWNERDQLPVSVRQGEEFIYVHRVT